MTDLKIRQLCDIMKLRGLAIICVQETRIPHTGCSILDNGYALITSGTSDNSKTYAGVGYLVAPSLRRSIYSFKLISERTCILKLRVAGGKITIVNAYAPHSGHEYGLRQGFFAELSNTIASASTYGPTLVVGDFNARIHNNVGGRDVFGDYCFGKADYNPQTHPQANRELLLELCIAKDMCVANTFMENDAENLVTYYDLWQNPVADISPSGFAQLDLIMPASASLQAQADSKRPLASSSLAPLLGRSNHPGEHRTAAQKHRK